jgi:hypothetical protein
MASSQEKNGFSAQINTLRQTVKSFSVKEAVIFVGISGDLTLPRYIQEAREPSLRSLRPTQSFLSNVGDEWKGFPVGMSKS